MTKKKKKDIKNFQKLEDKVTKLEIERDEYLDGWRRAKADLANFKKENAGSFERLNDIAKIELIREFLPVLDALYEAEKNNIDGLIPIKKLFLGILKNGHIQEIAPAEGEEFNPQTHEATAGTGLIIDSCQRKGFRYDMYVIRPAKVTVKEK